MQREKRDQQTLTNVRELSFLHRVAETDNTVGVEQFLETWYAVHTIDPLFIKKCIVPPCWKQYFYIMKGWREPSDSRDDAEKVYLVRKIGEYPSHPLRTRQHTRLDHHDTHHHHGRCINTKIHKKKTGLHNQHCSLHISNNPHIHPRYLQNHYNYKHAAFAWIFTLMITIVTIAVAFIAAAATTKK
jgi:hypothetical protein